MTISKRIQIILAAPLLALLLAMAALLTQSWNGLQRTDAILHEVTAAAAGGRLVHELQAERSLSNLRLVTGTAPAGLDDQRAGVDAAVQAYRAAVAEAPPHISARGARRPGGLARPPRGGGCGRPDDRNPIGRL